MSLKNLNIAIERINHARENKLRHLDLSGLQLHKLPDISDMRYLLDINLSNNQFNFFPAVLADLDNLNYLDISFNNIQDICFKLGKCYSLKELNISNNNLNFIPDELFFLESDTNIIFENNPFLYNIPPELEYQDNLLYLRHYQDALKKSNKRKRLFETKLLLVGKGDVGKTTLMKTLKNRAFNVEIGKEKATHGINIDQMTSRVYFPARNPYYSQEDFENIYIIDVEQDFDSEIDLNDESILDAYKPEIKNELVETYTHISEYIQDDGYSDYIMELRISEEPFHVFNDAFFEKEIKINMWDFGGQELLYGTHQFFLTQRSIYLFVWDSRPDNEIESFDYWLNIIQRLSNNSPVIIVMNKLDSGIKSIDESSYNQRFKNIIGFHQVSCFTKEGIDDLINEIGETIKWLPHISDEVPESWDIIRNKLKVTSKDFISYSEFKEICNLENAYFISSYLNDLGDIVHFQNDFALKDLVIVNPHWLTKAIYELIHSLEVQKNYGLFNANDLSSFLDEKKYPSENHHKILLLMEKFEICFKVIGANNLYVIPTLLRAMPPDSVFKSLFETPESLKYEIHYNFMPSGLIERLICRLKDFLKGNDFWKYGAVFKTELSEAIVLLNKPCKAINLYVIGNVKSELYSAITQEIKKINKDLKLKKEDYVEKLACNCINCITDESPYMIDSNVLLRFIEKGKNFIDCQKSSERANIEELLIGYKSSSLQKSLLRSFVRAFSKLQSHKKLIEGYDENGINTFFQVLLNPYLGENYYSNEQSLKGTSESEIKQGELDISIETKDGISISFFEGMILDSVNSSKINSHIQKTIKQYDPNGLKEKFIGIYYKAKNFNSFCKKYLNHITSSHPEVENITLIDVNDLSKTYINGSEIKVYRVNYERSGIHLRVYHLLLNLHLN